MLVRLRPNREGALSEKIYVINVGSNASHPFCSPIFTDDSFEFLPIPEDRKLSVLNGLRYKDLHSHNMPGEDLTRFIPKNYWDITVHNDPEFDTFTYGDNCEVNPRAMSLRNVQRGDFLFFLSRMELCIRHRRTGNFGFYFIGYLHVESMLKAVREKPNDSALVKFGVNAHVRRGMDDDALWDGFWVFGGSSWSKRFQTTKSITKEICQEVFLGADGQPWKWDEFRTDLQVIGSYTRTCRCLIDPSTVGGGKRARFFWDWIESSTE